MVKVKRQKTLLIFLIIPFTLCTIFLYSSAKKFFHLDFSQNYQEIEGIENIIFCDQGLLYKRTFWGLKSIGEPAAFHKTNTEEQKRLREALQRAINCENTIDSAISSTDKRYILYCEIKYNYKGSGITDDEYCYYRIYDTDTGKITTIYKGYQEWFDLNWPSL